MTATTRTTALFLAGPTSLFAYGIVRPLAGLDGPGAGWTVGHLLLLAGLMALGATAWRLWRWSTTGGLARRAVSHVSGAVTAIGLLASLSQTVIDLVVGFRTTDEAGQHRMFEQIQAHPVVLLGVYQVGPILFYVGLLALGVLLTVRPRRAGLVLLPALVLGTALIAASLDLMSVGALLYAVALGPWTWSRPSAVAQTSGPAAPATGETATRPGESVHAAL